MTDGNRITAILTDRSRAVVAVLLVLTALVGAGVPMVEQETSLDQFQGDTAESAAQDYVDANFSTDGEGAVTQIIVTDPDGDVLDRGSLLATLDYQQTVVANQTVQGSLAENETGRSIASAVGTRAVVEERAASLAARETELNRTADALERSLLTLESNPNVSVETAFESVEANTSVALDTVDYRTFENSARTLRDESTNATSRERALRNGSVGLLETEYDALATDYAALSELDPSLSRQQTALADLNETELESLLAVVLGGGSGDDGAAGGRSLALLPTGFEPGATEANATLVLFHQAVEGGGPAAGSAPDSLVDAELAMERLADDAEASYLVFGSGIVAEETTDSMVDSILLVGPLAALFVVVVLAFAYRDLLDILLGIAGVGTVLVWTFGVMGWVGIDFNQPFIIVVVLLIGLSIDYAIHLVMRYREERAGGVDPRPAMRTALGSVGVALLFVTVTTAIGFLANVASPLSVFRQIGVVSAIGIVSALVVFGGLVPAVKLELDEWLLSRGNRRDQPALGSEGSPLGRTLAVGATLARRAPVAVLVVAVLLSTAGAYGATQVDTSFSESDFLAEDPDQWLKDLPEPFAPGDYSAKRGMDTLNDRFVRQDTEATVLVRGDVADPETLDRLADAEADAAGRSTTQTYAGGETAITSPLTVMESVAAENESFAATLHESDTDDDGTPDENVSAVFDALHRSAPDEAAQVLQRTDDGEYVAARMVVSVDGSASGSAVTEDVREVAATVEGDSVTATATGQVVINAVTADQLLETVMEGLVVALVVVFLFLSLVYRVSEGSASLGAVTVVPVAFTVTWILGSMALLGVPFNIVTGLITSLTIGLGVDYSIHVSERFNQELAATGSVDAALVESVTGTGGALFSSAATTASGFGVLTVSLLPFLQSFGVITALTIVFSFLASVFVLPSLLALWARWGGQGNLDATAEFPFGPETDDPAMPADGPGTDETEPTAGDGLSATRTIPDPLTTAHADSEVSVVIAGAVGRVRLREAVPGPYEVTAVSPEPVELVERTDGFYALWDAGEHDQSLRISYETRHPADARDGDTVTVDGEVATEAGSRPVGGDAELVHVDDVFQRVLERGEAWDEDVQAAADRLSAGEMTEREFERVCRVWLGRERTGGSNRAVPVSED
ncbi:efflux RND transporter permease subunit [Haloarchaeobius litoreus]|uniref:RND family transporter n=1 Tax=Haloarchaeobius litoreus TaxID=755306 RepID=A0ABD6DGK7_9EURY|nr:MMPL family transporter [Haloarchaeobius litoreus]